MQEETDVVELVELWRRAFANLRHRSACPCCGGAPVRIDPGALEDDILYYLRGKYSAQNLDDLCALLTTRLGAKGEPFEIWLTALPNLVGEERAGIVRAGIAAILADMR